VRDIADSLGVTEDEAWKLVPGLWEDIGEKTARVRVAYMDAVTRDYAKNFTEKLSGWCRDHKVMYIGHIIEDMNASMHLGNSAGHYFRALDAEDMAGIDVVLHQVMPGQNGMLHTARIYDRIADPTFFVYALGKLAASHSHINPKMKGRAMCEIYGAYGFAEGLPFMKKLSDHFLANGINRFVPHAFTPKYPDPDCPPHFWCRGMNPQFALFGELMRYMQRVVHLMEGGEHQALALVYYNAESEWSGGRTGMYFEVAKALTRSQIDFDFASQDYILKVSSENGKLVLNGREYRALILPGCEYITAALDEKLSELAGSGAKIVFAGEIPQKTSEGGVTSVSHCAAGVEMEELGGYFRENIGSDITLSTPAPELRYYHTKRGALDIYMFKNDSEKTVDTLISGVSGDIAVYDAWRNRAYKKSSRRLYLDAGESAIWITGEDVSGLEEYPEYYECSRAADVDAKWDVDVMSVEDGERKSYLSGSPLVNISSKGGLTHFSGKLFYKTRFDARGDESFLHLGYVGETARVTLNGKDLGALIAPPYVFDVRGALKPGANDLGIEVVTNPVYRERDDFSRYMKVLPTGILGPVKLLG